MRAGALIDYQLRLYGAPIRWRTRIEKYQPPLKFVDMQIRGPYRRWRHTHLFEQTPTGTQIIDRVEYELACGPVRRLARAMFVRRSLEKIFAHRQERIAELLGPEVARPTTSE
jgi:hypothetical protein